MVGVVIGFMAARLVQAQKQNDQQDTLMTVSLDGAPGKEARVWVREIAPGERTSTHYHPGDVVAYVLQGSVVHTVVGKQPVTFSAGQAFHESAKDVHFGMNPSATLPVKLLTIQISDKDQPATIQVK